MDGLHLALSHLQDSVIEVRRALQKFEDEQPQFVYCGRGNLSSGKLSSGKSNISSGKSSRASSPTPITVTESWMSSAQAIDHIGTITRNWQDLSVPYRERVLSRLQDDEQIVFVMLPSPLDSAFTTMLNSNARDARCRKLCIMASICSVHCIWYSMAYRGYFIWGSKSRHVESAIQMLADMTNSRKAIEIAVNVTSSEEEDQPLSPDESPSPSVHNLNFDDLV